MAPKWYVQSHATCWTAHTTRMSIDFSTEKLAREYADFKNEQAGYSPT